MKRLLIFSLIAVFIVFSLLLSSCNNDSGATKDEASQSSVSPAETTVVLETTADGGTVEQDAEGNKITKDKSGEITSVVDKDGKTIEITEYITTHKWIVDSLSSGHDGNSDNGSSQSGKNNSNNSNNGSSSSSGSSSSKESGANSSSPEEVEGDIPVVIATVPDEDELEVIPDV